MRDTIDNKLASAGLRVCAYLFAVAFAVHLCYLCQYARTAFFWAPELDSLYDDLAGKAVASGHVGNDPYFRAPLYSYFLGLIYTVFGHNYWAARIAQAVIGSGSVVLLYRGGTKVFAPSVALGAALLMAFYGPIVFANGELHTPVLEIFLDLVLINTVLAGTGSREEPPARRLSRWVVLGLLLGLSAITRPSVLITLPLLLWRCFTEVRPVSRPAQAAGAAAAFLVATAVCPAMITYRNWKASGDPVFIASQGGINLYLGNRAGADGFIPSTPSRYRVSGPYQDSVELFGVRAADDALGHPVSASEAQRYWIECAGAWWAREPTAALALTWKKAVLLFTHREIRNNTAYDFARRELTPWLAVCPIGFWFAGPLGLLGIKFAWRRNAAARFLAVWAGVYAASFIPFFMADRYRLPVVPILLLFSAYAVDDVFRQCMLLRKPLARAITLRRLAPALALLAGFAAFVNVDWYPTETPQTWALDYWSWGNRCVTMGRYAEAETHFRHALDVAPEDAEVWNGLGETLYYQGRVRQAITAFSHARTGDCAGRASYNQALCAERLGDLASADRYLRTALNLEPDYPVARRELADVDSHWKGM